MTRALLCAALLTGALLTGTAQAATTSYTDATAFATASGPLSSEDFSGSTIGTNLQGTVDFGAFATTDTSAIGAPFNLVSDTGLNLTGMTGTNLQIALSEGQSFTFTFASAITAFGAIFANVNDEAFRSTFSGGGSTDWLAVGGRATGRFFGIVSDTAFTSITITGLAASEGFGIDDVRWASVPTVPVPASGLLLAGLALAGWTAKRRKA